MAPIIEVSNKVLKDLDELGVEYSFREETETSFDKDDFIYVPSIKLYVAKQRTLQNKNWFEAHKELQSNGERMMIIPEFVEFLKYIKTNFSEIYNDITEVRNPWRAEWLDADFKKKGRNLYINSNHVYKDGELVPKNKETLDKNTLMKDKTPGIDLNDWLNNTTKQGLPNKKIKSGSLYYWYPRDDNNSVARFDAGVGGASLNCDWNPSNRYSYLGVRAVRHE